MIFICHSLPDLLLDDAVDEPRPEEEHAPYHHYSQLGKVQRFDESVSVDDRWEEQHGENDGTDNGYNDIFALQK